MSDLRQSQWFDLASLDLRKVRGGTPRARKWRIAMVVTLLALATPFACWYAMPRSSVGVVIVDKTVADASRREHLRLMWWLTHARVAAPGGAWWRVTRDYVGYDPDSARSRLLDSTALARAHLAYLADAYGVYTADVATAAGTATGAASLARSTLIFGGVQLSEARALAAFRARGGAVMAEFNVLESPTAGTAAGALMESLLGTHYLGWIARGYDDLSSDDEIPPWMRAKWLRRHTTPWTFTGPGYVLFSENEDRIVVVERREFEGPMPLTLEVDRPGDPLMRGVHGGAGYGYWVSGIAPTDSGVVLASFQLHVDSAARARVTREGFPLRFPAVVRRLGGPLAAYVAADIADAALAPPYVQRTVFLDWWRARRVRGSRGIDGELDFFWRVAAPLWDAALRLAEPDRR